MDCYLRKPAQKPGHPGLLKGEICQVLQAGKPAGSARKPLSQKLPVAMGKMCNKTDDLHSISNSCSVCPERSGCICLLSTVILKL